jgi:circadian clock protein KaiC
MKDSQERLKTGVANLDKILHGGLPRDTVTVFGGTPGSGKTILSQQICFANATPARPAVIFNTLSESTPKTLRYLRPFSFFKESAVGKSVHFVDLGNMLRTKGLAPALAMILEHLRKLKPAFVVIDSFKAFDELSDSREDLRKFTYEVAVNLMAWECTALLLGEFSPDDLASNPLFSIVDGIVVLASREVSGEQQRSVQVVKMRGTDHSRDRHPMTIADNGISIYAPRVTLRNAAATGRAKGGRFRFGVGAFDELTGKGVPYGSSILISGDPGTGKTLFALESIYRGAKEFGEKGIFFSFDESEERLREAGRELGWALDKEIARGMLKVVFMPQLGVPVESTLLRIEEEITALGAKRAAVDSLSMLFYKVDEDPLRRENIIQLATIMQRSGAVGLFTSSDSGASIEGGRFGIEATVVDGIIRLSLVEQGLDNEGYIEVYKLRGAKHRRGRHPFDMGPKGWVVSPRP